MRKFFSVRFLVALGCVALGSSINGSAVAQDELPQPGNQEAVYKQQVSYCLGLNFGASLREDEIDVDLAGLVAGLRDALSGAKPQLTDEQMNAVMDRFQLQLQQKAESRMGDIAAENQAKGEKFLAENASKEGVQTTDSGLQYKVVEEGDGASPGPRDLVRCHYEGTLIDGTVFDSSYKRGEPAEFGVHQVIAGWTEALQMMKVGSKWEVYLPSEIAYGPRGAGGAIGPNETLIFTIELLDVK